MSTYRQRISAFSQSRPQSTTFWKLAACKCLCHLADEDLERTIKRCYPDDGAIPLLERAAVVPANTQTPSWAATLSQSATGAFLSGIAVRSAAARLFEACLRVQLKANHTINLPYMSAQASPIFVAEGDPIPARRG